MTTAPTATGTAYRTFTLPEADAYRDPYVRQRANLAGLRETVDRTRARADAISRVVGGQLARVAFGMVALASTVAIVATMLLELVTSDRPALVTEELVFGWLAAVAAFVVVRLGATFVLRPQTPALRGSLERDTAAFEAELAARDRRRALATPALERAALTLPAVAAALNTPLSLHLIAAAALSVGTPSVALHEFDGWMKTSVILVGHAHAVLAVLAYRHAKRVAAMTEGELAGDRTLGFRALGWTVLTAAIPGVILIALPPIVTAVTGILFIPLLWAWLRQIAIRDRRRLRGAGVAA